MSIASGVWDAPHEPTPTWETITPQFAEETITNHNVGNRRVKTAHVNALARAMLDGKFLATGDPIKFDATGNLLDGQNRLNACIKAGVPFRSLVLRDLPVEVRDVIDTGAARTAADVLTFAEFKNSKTLAAIARIAIQRERGQYTHAIPNRGVPKLLNYEILEWVEAHPDVSDFLAQPRPSIPSVRLDGFVSESVWLYAAWVLWTIDSDDALEFQRAILERSYGSKGQPLWAFKEGLRKTRNPSGNVTQEVSISQALYLIFRCWNDWREDTIVNRAYSVSYLTHKPTGDLLPRAVPEPR